MAKPRPWDQPAIVDEETYDRMIVSYHNTPKKAKKHWKYPLIQRDGTYCQAKYVDGLFIYHFKSIRYCVMGETSLNARGINWSHGGFESFWQDVYNAHTGNHKPKNHAIKVPTKASEPVRG